MHLPSVKTLAAITSYSRELRKVLELPNREKTIQLMQSSKPFGPRSQFGTFTSVNRWHHLCFNPPTMHQIKMLMANELCETHGVEVIPKGHNAKSPALEYLNTGDSYGNTLLFVNGRYRVGCWGDIVERGNYD